MCMPGPWRDYCDYKMGMNARRHRSLTFQGMTAVNPGRLGEIPVALNISWPALNSAVVRVKVQSGDREPRKWRAT